jgi:20S proteasome subunit beta 3
MTGKNCVGICSDTRLGAQAQTVAKDFKKIFEINEKVFVGLAGLASDVLSLHELLQFRCNLYKFREHREIKPQTFSALLSTLLYEKRSLSFFSPSLIPQS